MSTEASPRRTILLGPPGGSFRTSPPLRFGHAEVLAGIAALSFLVARFVPVVGLFPPCPFRAALGVPCASCGMTRAFVALAHGDVAAALGASPLGAVLAALAWGFAVAAMLRPLLRFRWPRPAPAAARRAALAGAAALLVNWAWLVAAGRPHP
ncbi:MAG TPA: DUF2752 domain-containing protein [Anaeromyxobacteraceae bacterium]|nr:DUF2752 domain-containing protein [Anaeromyxobacteraceae bacterium]